MIDPNAETQEINTILIDLSIFDSIEDLEQDTEGFQSYDLGDDAEALASIGWGTDEDYGLFGTEDY